MVVQNGWAYATGNSGRDSFLGTSTQRSSPVIDALMTEGISQQQARTFPGTLPESSFIATNRSE
uniref:Uncharacterized protein n=2 Tax=Oryza sativa subsp. japonica TaxID=39947 RepID=A0A5S6R8T3_ORYSJ|nr:hypothetical protein [Oryza sativa Japonica Group]AAN64448.1 hypothetical protein [Oryza sativa Japonica Group]ABF97066.1 hypothetical protein LOC_Os03g35810 [Oryza sativa Japonica Group]